MIGLLDWDIYQQSASKRLVPNLEIMKLATYYLREQNKFCQLLTPDTQELSNYDKIYYFSEAEMLPKIPEQFSRANNIIFGGTAFTQQYQPFENSLIDFLPANTKIYKNFLKQKYADGAKAKVVNAFLDDSYYRMFADKTQLPIPPIFPNKHIYIYDKNLFIGSWKEILNEISNRKPSSIICIHPIVCDKLTKFFELREINKFSRENDIILDLNIPLTQIRYLFRNYKKLMLAEITPYSHVFLPIGGTYATKKLYYQDFVYKLNLLYSFWSCGIMIKMKVRETPIGYFNPIYNLEKKLEEFNFKTKKNQTLSLNDKIPKKAKKHVLIEQRQLILDVYPSAEELFNQSYEKISTNGEWRT